MLDRLLAPLAAIAGLGRARQVTLPNARARVRRGAAYLDGADPGWRDRIDPDSLELADGSHCVLGQLHGEFRAGLLRTRIWDASSAPSPRLFAAASPADLGFHAITTAGEDLAALDYALLNRAWREEIAARQRGPVARGRPAGAPA
jgi:hypothetical protein